MRPITLPLIAPIIAVIMLATPAAPVLAYGMDMSLPMMNSAFAVNAYSLQAQLDSIGSKSDRDDEPEVSTLAGKIDPAVSVVPARLAAQYPPARRAEAEQTFRELLAGHARLMRQLGVAPDDMAGAMASFVAGAVMAYNDVDIADADFPALVDQMRSIIATNPAFAAASPAQRRQSFAELAIMGTMAATTRLALAANPSHPAAATIRANLKAAAASYLATITKKDPAQLKITARGLNLGI